eukprot:TRINITY_DN3412_c0_g3_i1.p1 TRINITY_DN3412_c0_g3~~TRINITY_DN3412_c0_g3_i1.p1  ORF type:complete len:105 (-),score=30.54 TRINITY_DN3412_c0_g3_i1:411-725(-)
MLWKDLPRHVKDDVKISKHEYDDVIKPHEISSLQALASPREDFESRITHLTPATKGKSGCHLLQNGKFVGYHVKTLLPDVDANMGVAFTKDIIKKLKEAMKVPE